MRNRLDAAAGVAILLFLTLGCSAYSQARSRAPGTVPTEAAVKARASGTFEVQLTPQSMTDSLAGGSIARMSIDKQFHGDLEATSQGEMLSAGGSVKGSAGYVAIERASGTLHGRRGTFVLQHSGTMTRGAADLTITVVPDSGTDELVGLAGKMTITITAGKHSYDFEYTLAGTK